MEGTGFYHCSFLGCEPGTGAPSELKERAMGMGVASEYNCFRVFHSVVSMNYISLKDTKHSSKFFTPSLT